MLYKKIRRICVLTGGGDAPGLNAVIEGIVNVAEKHYGWKVLGSEDGFEGLIQPPSNKKIVPLTASKVKNISTKGGSILGCSNIANPWAYPKKVKGKTVYLDLHKNLLSHIQHHKIDALILIGGDGTMTQAKMLADLGVNVVGVPKTIDNDLAATDYTFGFDTALSTATWAIDKLHTTAHAHDRVMIVEVMGRYAGWIALEAGIASSAHCILIPEIPYRVEGIISKIKSLGGRYSSYGIIVCSEGARQHGKGFVQQGKVIKTKDGKIAHLPKLGGAAQRLANSIKGKIPHDVRVTVLGHVQRGGAPTPFDRILGLRFGVAVAHLVARRGFGRMVALTTPSIVDIPLDEVIGRQKLVDPNGELVQTAKALGIEFGD